MVKNTVPASGAESELLRDTLFTIFGSEVIFFSGITPPWVRLLRSHGHRPPPPCRLHEAPLRSSAWWFHWVECPVRVHRDRQRVPCPNASLLWHPRPPRHSRQRRHASHACTHPTWSDPSSCNPRCSSFPYAPRR